MSTVDFCGLRAGFARPRGAGLDAPTRRGTGVPMPAGIGENPTPLFSLPF